MQIRELFGNLDDISVSNAHSVIVKVATVLSLQKKYFESYLWEHEYKSWHISIEELHALFMDTSADTLMQKHFPSVYEKIFVPIMKKRASFSSMFQKRQIDQFFYELNDRDAFLAQFDVLQQMIAPLLDIK